MPTVSLIQPQLKEHEEWLIGLRRDSDMTLARICTELEKQKSITAAPHQLETFFRNLGYRKNLSRPDWIKVFRALDSQEEFGCRFDLYVSGKLITGQNLKNKRKNARPAQSLATSLAEANRLIRELPDRVTVKQRLSPGLSPGGLQQSITPQLVSHASPNIDHNGEAGMLLDSNSTVNEGMVPSGAIDPISGNGSDSIGFEPASTSNAIPVQLAIASPNMEAHAASAFGVYEGSDMLINFTMDELDHIPIDLDRPDEVFDFPRLLSPGNWPRGFSPMNSQHSLHIQANRDAIWPAEYNATYATSTSAGHAIRELSLIDSARQLVEDHISVLLQRGRAPFPTGEQLLGNLQSLMPTNTAAGDFRMPLDISGGNGVFPDQFIQLLLFSVVNNFAGFDDMPAELIMNFINQHELVRSSIFSHLRKGTSIVLRSLEEKLFEAAIEACDARTIHDLLALGTIRPDDIVCSEHSHDIAKTQGRRTPLEKASRLRHLDIMGLLVRFGADVNKTYQNGPHSEQGALECAIGLDQEYSPIDITLVDLLLDKGANVRARLMENAIYWGDPLLIERLISRLALSEHVRLFSCSVFHAAKHLRNDIGHKFVRQVMQTCRDTHNNACIGSNQQTMVNAMCGAARRNNRDLVNLLLPHGGQKGLDSALTAATRFGSHSLVRLLLAHGARGDGSPCTDVAADVRYSTPLAEAIRGKDVKLMALFAKEGAWDQIGEPGRLRAALDAIAESGDLISLHKVLHLVPNLNAETLGHAVIRALESGHENIALKLMETDADLLDQKLCGVLEAALRLKSQYITWKILESEGEFGWLLNQDCLKAAIEWGDKEIIDALCFMGADTSTHRCRPLLTYAIKAGNRSLVETLVNRGADQNVNDSKATLGEGLRHLPSPLAAAALVSDTETADYLLDHGADPADEEAIINAITHDRRLLDHILLTFRQRYPKGLAGFGDMVLKHVLQNLDQEAMEMCLRAGFGINNMGCHENGKSTALGLAIKKYRGNCLDWVSKLLDAGGNSNLPANQTVKRISIRGSSNRVAIVVRQTAFLDAIETKSLELVKLLMSKGADVGKEAKLGLRRTPLQKACEVGSHTIVDLLLEHGADVNEPPAARGGATALQLAAKSGSTRIATRLLDLGAEVNAPGARFSGQSSIEFAAEYGRFDMIAVLCNAPGGQFTAGQYGSAISLARENGHAACAVRLLGLSSGSQQSIGDGSMADDGSRPPVIIEELEDRYTM